MSLKEKFQELKKNHPFVVLFLFLYLGFLMIYILIFQVLYADYSKPMPLNEIGDFLAGVFSPLAFLFLYLGYVQNNESIRLQSKELKASTDALTLQVAEMRESVEQQKLMSELQRTELEERHNAATPFFTAFGNIDVSYQMHGGRVFKFNIEFENTSDHDAKNVVIFLGFDPALPPLIFSKNSRRTFTPTLLPSEIDSYTKKSPFNRIIHVDFENIYGRKFRHTFVLICRFYNDSPQVFIQDNGMIRRTPYH